MRIVIETIDSTDGQRAVRQVDLPGGFAGERPRSVATASQESDSWNADLRRIGGHILQSWEWGAFKERHGWTVRRVRVAGEHGEAQAQVLFRRKGPISIAYVPRGPALAASGDPKRLFAQLRTEMDGVCRDGRAVSLILEPNRPLGLMGSYRNAGFVRGPHPFQPGRTVMVPLLPDDELIAQMHQKNRYNIRLAQRRGVIVERGGSDPRSTRAFYDLLGDTANRNGFAIHSRAYYDDFMAVFGDRALLLFAVVEGEIAAAAIAVRFGDEAAYMYGASSTAHRAHAGAFLLQFEAMRWARDHGCRRYDLWGIPDTDPEPGDLKGDMPGAQGEDWRGLHNFKVRFGGEIVRYPMPMERRYRPILAVAARRFGIRGG